MCATQAAELLNVEVSTLDPFSATDSYNKNELEGYLCKQSDHRYGALVIYKVNGILTGPQVIYCTPKLQYPFSKDLDRSYHWPKFKKVVVYEKLDGTNIFAYSYSDKDGNKHTTFKTRLTPVLKANKFGDFVTLWNSVLEKYPNLLDFCKAYTKDGCGLSFELYGLRNIITIKYSTPIDARLLFAVADGCVEIPEALTHKDIVGLLLKSCAHFNNTQDITEFYNKLRLEAEANNTHNEDGSVTGTEGYVFYVLTEDDRWQQFKCKPEDIEKIHWASDTIPKTSIYNTVLNAVEDFDGDIRSPAFKEHVMTLLAEEYTEVQLQKSFERINKCIHEGIQHIVFRQKLQEVVTTIDLNGDKGFIMRQLSKHFPKNEMSNVYNTMVELKYIKD